MRWDGGTGGKEDREFLHYSDRLKLQEVRETLEDSKPRHNKEKS